MNYKLTARAQIILVWWALITMLIFGFSMFLLMHMVPPPSAALSPAEIAQFYKDNQMSIRVGAMITSWTSAFMVPLAIVISWQMRRIEQCNGLLSMAQLLGGGLMSMFLVFPPMLWGFAAFTPDRAVEITATLHEMGSLTLATTDQFYMFQLFAIIYISLAYKNDELSPFPRWMGWLTLWACIIYEVGPLGFMFKTGVFAWDGIVVFWMPFVTFGAWISAMSFMLLRAIKRQSLAAAS